MKKWVMGALLVGIIGVNGVTYGILPKQQMTIRPENLIVVEAPGQQESMEHESFQKDDYVFVTPEGTNIALDGKITSNGMTGAYNERKAVDGEKGGASYWEGAADSYPNELSLTFAEPHTIHTIRIALNPDSIWGKRTQTFAIMMTDVLGEEQVLRPEQEYVFDPAYGNEVIIEVEDVELMSVTLIFTANTGASAGQVAELEVYE